MKQLGRRGSCIAHCFFLIGFFVTGVNSLSALLSQSPSPMIQLVNQAVEISCTVKEESMENLGLYWLRKTERDEELEFIISSTSQLGKASYGHKISPDKFKMKRTQFQNYFTLSIANLDHTDSGVYYCMTATSIKQEYVFGNGTILSVVDFLPTTTIKPKTTKKKQQNVKKCKCKKISTTPVAGVSCSAVIWAPLSGLALMLMIGLYLLTSHTYRVYRRTYMYFRKYSPK
ncbi:T-cell surface glycoprotein CD8 beta chain [Anomaloglossus baeobatrachus]|uniref:T-cell surface glycoprotein CD8 beta chain n=1 Tax=Anomaloglossus baeobatrachus TaxID=238106 RepID=UPI003F502B78